MLPDDQIREWLLEVAVSTGCMVEMLARSEEDRIVSQLQATYINSVSDPASWWRNLKLPYEHFKATATALNDILPSPEGHVYLLPEAPRIPFVYRIKTSEVQTVLDECPFFIYAVAAEDGSWLVLENDHNDFFRCVATDAIFLHNLDQLPVD